MPGVVQNASPARYWIASQSRRNRTVGITRSFPYGVNHFAQAHIILEYGRRGADAARMRLLFIGTLMPRQLSLRSVMRSHSRRTGHEHVADAADGADCFGVGGVVLDLATEASHAEIDRTIERFGLAMAGRLQQPIA